MKASILQISCAFLMAGALFAQTPPPQTSSPTPSPGTKRIRPKNADPQSLPPQQTNVSKSKIVRPGVDDVALNPQPLPPVDGPAKTKIVRPGVDDVSLNPQPLPPVDGGKINARRLQTQGSETALNPQPLPPVDGPTKTKIVRPGVDDVSLNPQPLPPVDGGKINARRLQTRGSETALNPQPLPPVASFVLSNGQQARIVGRRLMVKGTNGETKANPGRYQTKDGRVLVVNKRGEISN